MQVERLDEKREAEVYIPIPPHADFGSKDQWICRFKLYANSK
jgi:hypothetical protein